MILKATVKCTCGCSYEMVSCKNHELAKCPNCSKVFSESDKLVDILKTFNSIDLTKDKDKSTDLFESVFHNESLVLHSVDENDFNVHYESDNE
ncbi:hypothetical protein [Roseburia sp. 1XD42-69]|uniref:hypothetical protein n=1 Tax=Roseburia sp. 1XD42-69 TaxID=2320088 RepID=UPI000EA3C2D0|nr:hypothetical protein [Roseburia sp. 1XD42-69]RKJ62072.1 hypothetical protein D7Y06_18395 [Roseburia sp. 1XD42-69]